MAQMEGRTLRPLILILGGVRKEGKRKVVNRQNTRRSHSRHGPTLELQTHEKRVIKEPDQYRAAVRFVKHVNDVIADYVAQTPFGRVGPTTIIPGLRKLREDSLKIAASHNPKNPEWQLRVELSWQLLDDDALSTLLTLMAEELPPSFFETPEPRVGAA